MNKETILQNKIIVALCERGCFAVNHTVGDFFTQYGGRVSVGVPGESDIWGHRPDGKAFYVEVKLPGEKPRKNQLDFIEAMKNSRPSMIEIMPAIAYKTITKIKEAHKNTFIDFLRFLIISFNLLIKESHHFQ